MYLPFFGKSYANQRFMETTTLIPRALLAVAIAGAITGCGGRGDPSNTLHQDCTDANDCSAEESCAVRAHPEGTISSCEIRCTDDDDCPSGHRCNAPPCVPDDVMCIYCTTL